MIRLQLRLQGAAEDMFRRLTDMLKSDSRDVVLDSLALMHFAAEQVTAGRKVGSYDPETREFVALTTHSLEGLAASNSEKVARSRAAASVR